MTTKPTEFQTLQRTRARSLRRNSTEAEKRLWYYLRAHRFDLKFKRQEPILNYIVDFVCHTKKLIIEIDGGQHLEHLEYDAQRSAELNGLGYQILRFWNHDVLLQTEVVIEVIYQALAK